MRSDEIFDLYYSKLQTIVGGYVLAYSAAVREHYLRPWFDNKCRASRRRSRMLECCYRRTLRADDRLALIRQVRCMHSLYEKKEKQY